MSQAHRDRHGKTHRFQTKALLRVNPGISAHTHEYIMTAKPDSKFGIFIDDTEHIGQVIELQAESSHVRLAGFHSHIGSQIMDARVFSKSHRHHDLLPGIRSERVRHGAERSYPSAADSASNIWRKISRFLWDKCAKLW